MKKMVGCIVSSLFFQYLISMQAQTYQVVPINEVVYRIPISSVKGLRAVVTGLSEENPLSLYDVQPNALLEYFFSDDTKAYSVGQQYVKEALQGYWQEGDFCSSGRYNKIVEQVVQQIQQGEQLALHDCLQKLHQLPIVKAQKLQKDIDAIKSDYQQKMKVYRSQIACNALLGLTMIALAAGIGLEVWTMTLYCYF